MSGTEFLNGKVRKWSLPVVENAAGADAARAKRLMLPQGELAQFYSGDEPIHYVAFIELRAGAVRGNHFHRAKEERIYIIRGELRLLLQDVDSGARETAWLRTGDLVAIPPGVAHALRVTQSGDAVEFSPTRFDPADVCRFALDSDG